MAKNLYYEDEAIETHFNKEMLTWLFSYVKRHRKKYLTVLLVLIAAAILALLPAALNMQIINRVLPKNGVAGTGDMTAAIVILTICAGVFIGTTITSYFSVKLSNRMGNDIIYEIRQQLYDKLMGLGFDYFDGQPTGKILVRITNYTDEIAHIFINHLTELLVQSGTMVITFLVVLLIDYRLAEVIFVSMAILSVIIFKLSKVLQKRAENDKNKNSNRTAFVAESINGLSVVKAFNREQLNGEIHQELCDQYTQAFLFTTRVREAFFPLANGIIRIVCVILIYGVSLLILQSDTARVLTLGALVSVTTYMQIFSEAVFAICQRLQNISTLTTNLERIYDTLAAEENVKDGPDSYPLPEIKGDVVFEDVSFSYDGNENILEHFDLHIHPGETVALIGATGAGKTTIVNLLNRFYDVQSGRILIDGHDLREVTISSLRSQIGVMMQDSFLFGETVLENIRFARPEATDEECKEAARRACAERFILNLPDGYETVIGENTEMLSGGERQMLSFARLILANPRLIILDEATSNVDSETEQKMQQAMKKELENRTSFVIAHRLSTIQEADLILYIDGKNIAEMGTHHELMAKQGKYYQLHVQKVEKVV